MVVYSLVVAAQQDRTVDLSQNIFGDLGVSGKRLPHIPASVEIFLGVVPPGRNTAFQFFRGSGQLPITLYSDT